MDQILDQKTIDYVYAELKKDQCTVYRKMAIIAFVITVGLVGFTIFMGNILFGIFCIPSLGFAIYSLFICTAFEKKYPKENIDCLRRICLNKSYVRSTTGRFGYLKFGGKLVYEVHPLKGKLYEKTSIGDPCYLAIEKNTAKILLVLLDEESKKKMEDEPIIKQRTIVPGQEPVEGFTPNMRSMVNADDAPILLCNLLHQIKHANPAAKKYYDRSYLSDCTLFDVLSPEQIVIIQKALNTLSTDPDQDVVETDGTPALKICAVRDDAGTLTGYTAKII